jgi:predicted transcriptional regulator
MSAKVKELPITARLPVRDVRQLEKLAKASDRTRSAEVRRAVRTYLDAKAA